MSAQGKTKEEILRERKKQKILGGASNRLNLITGVHPTKTGTKFMLCIHMCLIYYYPRF